METKNIKYNAISNNLKMSVYFVSSVCVCVYGFCIIIIISLLFYFNHSM